MASSSARAISVASAAEVAALPFSRSGTERHCAMRCQFVITPRIRARRKLPLAALAPRAQRAPWHLLESALRRCPLRSGPSISVPRIETQWCRAPMARLRRSAGRSFDSASSSSDFNSAAALGEAPVVVSSPSSMTNDLISPNPGTSPTHRSASRNSSFAMTDRALGEVDVGVSVAQHQATRLAGAAPVLGTLQGRRRTSALRRAGSIRPVR